jgi:hypothetical protein
MIIRLSRLAAREGVAAEAAEAEPGTLPLPGLPTDPGRSALLAAVAPAAVVEEEVEEAPSRLSRS